MRTELRPQDQIHTGWESNTVVCGRKDFRRDFSWCNVHQSFWWKHGQCHRSRYVCGRLHPKQRQELCQFTDPTGEEAKRQACWRKNLAILDRTRLHKHGTLSPESLHAESQWGRPDQVGQEVQRSELGDLIPEGITVGSTIPLQRPCGRVSSTNVESSGPRPLPRDRTYSVTFEGTRALLRN